MNAALQNQINPPVVKNNEYSVSNAKVDDNTGKKPNEKAGVDFDMVMANSSENIRRQREAIKNGDLSAKSEDEFFNKLAEQTKQKVDKKNELKKDDFLKLFVAQLQNQDPLNPDDGAEMATKLAQFNSLEQMMNMNTTLEKLATGQNTGRNLQLVNYVGQEVTLNGGRIKLNDNSVTQSEFEVKNPAVNASIEVRDGSGALVYQRELGPLQAGSHSFSWNGQSSDGKDLPDGVYTYSVHALDIEGGKIPIEIHSKARITGVDIQSEDGALYSELGRVGFDEILSVGRPGFQVEAKPKAAAGAPPAGPEAKPLTNANPNATTEELQRRQANGELSLGDQLLDPAKLAAFEARKQAKNAQNTTKTPTAENAETSTSVNEAPNKDPKAKERGPANEAKVKASTDTNSAQRTENSGNQKTSKDEKPIATNQTEPAGES